MILCLVLFLIGLTDSVDAQEPDMWSGNFIVKSSASIPVDTIIIQKITDANKEGVASEVESGLQGWMLSSKQDNYEDKIIARPFLFDEQNDKNEYEQFGWTELYLKGEMSCIDAGHLFICQTKQNSQVQLGDDASFFTKTGIFGIRLHYGLFELERF